MDSCWNTQILSWKIYVAWKNVLGFWLKCFIAKHFSNIPKNTFPLSRPQLRLSLVLWFVLLAIFPSQFKIWKKNHVVYVHCNYPIATFVCTWHDSFAVVPCAYNCSDIITRNGITARRNFPFFTITRDESFVRPSLVYFPELCWYLAKRGLWTIMTWKGGNKFLNFCFSLKKKSFYIQNFSQLFMPVYVNYDCTGTKTGQ